MADEEPTIYLTADEALVKKVNKRRKFVGEPPIEWKPNFRYEVAKTKPYKGTRNGDKPYHYHNITAYLMANYDVKLAVGIEADDLMSIDQVKSEGETVICSRDKDLRITPGWHYGWACGKQPEFEMQMVDDLGWIEYNEGKKKIEGVGMKFFYSQMLTGDTVDNIPGVKRCGPKGAYKLLNEAESVDECKRIVTQVYKEKYPENAKEYFTEQAQLLWMVRELDEEGNPVPRGWNNVK